MRRKKGEASLLDNIWVIVGLVMLAGILIAGVIGMYGKNKKTRLAREAMSEELSDLEIKYENLENRLEKLSTDRGIEEELRDQYHVVENGEEQIVIIENEPENIDNDEGGWLADLFH